MIWYFSGTGNSRWVAEELARRTGDSARDLTKVSGMPSVQGQVLGVVFPIHAWSVPQVVEEFLRKLAGTPTYAFAVCTCGEEVGLALDDLKKNQALDSVWSVVLPSNYIPGADLEPEDMMRSKFSQAQSKLETMANHINARESVTDITRGALPALKTRLIGKGFRAAGRSTRPFSVSKACIGCALCAQDCPAQAIVMVKDRPHWTKPSCYLCTACLNRCPTQAINYGKGTRRRKRYRIEEHLPLLPGDPEQADPAGKPED